jgi:hypothetical protein
MHVNEDEFADTQAMLMDQTMSQRDEARACKRLAACDGEQMLKYKGLSALQVSSMCVCVCV